MKSLQQYLSSRSVSVELERRHHEILLAKETLNKLIQDDINDRVENLITLEKISQRMKINYGTLSRVKNGRRMFTNEQVIKYYEFLKENGW